MSIRALLAPILDRLLLAALRLAPQVDVSGLSVALACRRGPERDHALARLNAACELLERYAPERMRRVRSELHRIVLYDAGPRLALGQFNPRLRFCGINIGYLGLGGAGDTLHIARILAHEAMHGRLSRLGLRESWRMDRRTLHRVERLCLKAEWAVLKRILQPEAQLARFAAAYESDLETVPERY